MTSTEFLVLMKSYYVWSQTTDVTSSVSADHLLSFKNLVNFLYIWCASNTTLGTFKWSPTNCLNCLSHKKKLQGSTPSASLSSYYPYYTSIFPALCWAILFSRVLARIIFDTDKHFGCTGIRQGEWRGNTRVGRECELCKLSPLL
jgi:hypothetical protein